MPALAKAKTRKDIKSQQEAQAHHEARKKSGKKGWQSFDRDKADPAYDCNKDGRANS